MDIKGLWTLVSAKGMDMKTFEVVWFPNDAIKAFPDDNFMKSLADAAFEIGDDFVKICNKVRKRSMRLSLPGKWRRSMVITLCPTATD